MQDTVDTEEIPEEYRAFLERIGFQLESFLGSGLSGRVIKAWQPRLKRHVAVKFCDGPSAIGSDALRLRFEREARLLAALQHPSIPYVLTTGKTPGDVLFTVMQFIEGPSLRQVLDDKGALDPHTAVQYAVEIASALSVAHSAGILHRDVKPDNVLLSPTRAVLIDFSIGVDPAARPEHPTATSTGEGLGSFYYMCPEQNTDLKSVDERGDIYSLGVVLFEMLVGHPKIRIDRIDEDLSAIELGVRDILKTACAVGRDDRYSSTEELVMALRPFASSSAPRTPQVALCTWRECPDADWTSRGYYRGPRVVSEATQPFCGSCGHRLLFSCSGCHAVFDNSRFCGNCGQEWYSIPECMTCGSWLQLSDMDLDTQENCCTKGRRRAASQTDWSGDVPF